jgi:hypothetical protein
MHVKDRREKTIHLRYKNNAEGNLLLDFIDKLFYLVKITISLKEALSLKK